MKPHRIYEIFFVKLRQFVNALFKKIIPSLLIFLVFTGCKTGTSDKKNREVFVPEDLMGMVHAGYANGNLDRIDDEYRLLDQMGVSWMMRDFSWNKIQPERDIFEWYVYDDYVERALLNNKKILGLLCYDVHWIHGVYNERTGKYECGHSAQEVNGRIVSGEEEIALFKNYISETVSRYRGKVSAWCIWNEPNMKGLFWGGNPKEFFDLTKAAAAAVREADPEVLIAGGALNAGADNSVWTRGLFRSGAMEQVDLFAYHPYADNAEASLHAYNNFCNYLFRNKFNDRVWITEIGFPLDMGGGGYSSKVSPEKSPETTVKTITLLAAAGAEKIFWYEMFDYGKYSPPGDSEAWFGLVDFDTFTKKRSGEAYGLCANNIPGKTFKPLASAKRLSIYGVETFYFEGRDGRHTLILWNSSPAAERKIKVNLFGSDFLLWNISGGNPLTAENEFYCILNAWDSIKFITWENYFPLLPPEVELVR